MPRPLRSLLAIATIVALPVSAPSKRPVTAPWFNPPRLVVDLSPTLAEDTPSLVVGRKFLHDFGMPESTQFHQIISEEPMYVAETRLELFNHVGPHHDAPSHTIKGARTTDSFGLDQFIGPAKVLDFRTKPKDAPLTRADFANRGIVGGRWPLPDGAAGGRRGRQHRPHRDGERPDGAARARRAIGSPLCASALDGGRGSPDIECMTLDFRS